MLTTQSYQVSYDHQEVTIKLNRSLISQDKLEQFLDYLTIKAIQQKSVLSESLADELIAEINHAVWEKQKNLFEL